MANAKPVSELPRFLLPRLTWTTTTKHTTPIKTSIQAFHKHIQASQAHISQRQIHTNSQTTQQHRRRTSSSSSSSSSSPFNNKNNNTPHSHSYSTSTSTTTSRTPFQPSSSSSSNPNLPPLRHNGIYAKVFKPARQAYSFSTTPQPYKSHHFDTLKFVQRLKSEGFNEAQAIAMMRVLNDVIEESIQNLTRTMVLKEDAERTTYTQKVDFAKLRSELANADSSELQLTRGSHEKLTSDLAKLNSRLRDEIGRTQASVRLDLNLEKGRIREEANTQEMRIKETEARIEQEVASLRERVEAVKFSTLQWLMGVCTGTAALILGAWRLLM